MEKKDQNDPLEEFMEEMSLEKVKFCLWASIRIRGIGQKKQGYLAFALSGYKERQCLVILKS